MKDQLFEDEKVSQSDLDKQQVSFVGDLKDPEVAQQYQIYKQRDRSTWVQRAFSKIEKDSLRSAVLMLLVASLGTAIFAFYHVFNDIGIINTFVLEVIVIASFILSIDIIIIAYKKVPQANSIQEIIKYTGGNVLYAIYIVLFVLFLFVILVGITLVVSKLLFDNFGLNIMNLLGVSKQYQTYEHFNSYAVYVISFVVFLLLLQKSINAFQNFVFLCFGIFMFITIVILYQFPIYYEDLKEKHQDDFNYFQFTWESFFQQFGLMVYSFNCTHNFHGIANGVLNPSRRRILKVFKRSFILLGFFMGIIGLASYYSLGTYNADKIDLVIFRQKISETDYMMMIARSFFIINMVIGAVLNAFPLKQIISSLMPERNKDIYINVGCFVMLIFNSIICSIFTNVSNFLSLAGALTCIVTCYTIPGLVALKIGYCKNQIQKIGMILWVTIMTILSIICTIVTLKKF